MTPLEAAKSTAAGVSAIASHFMIDPGTYHHGAQLGFSGIDFYAIGRGGALGDVDADVVSASFAFWEPGLVRSLWEQGRAVSQPLAAANEFARCAHAWGEANVGDQVNTQRLADLACRAVAGARSACAPLFAAWRRMPAPESPRAAAVHQMHLLRELRGALHAAAILAQGLTPHEAVSVDSPAMTPLFGWGEPVPDPTGLLAQWQAAEEGTDRAFAHVFSALEDRDREELVELIVALHDATKPN